MTEKELREIAEEAAAAEFDYTFRDMSDFERGVIAGYLLGSKLTILPPTRNERAYTTSFRP